MSPRSARLPSTPPGSAIRHRLALRALDLTVPRRHGRHPGPNGAGKTTAMLLATLRDTAARHGACSARPVAERTAIRRRLGLVFRPSIDGSYRPRESPFAGNGAGSTAIAKLSKLP
jgi:ABC-type molybdenum transport system ATPase subunit/photorepair protein PhrA